MLVLLDMESFDSYKAGFASKHQGHQRHACDSRTLTMCKHLKSREDNSKLYLNIWTQLCTTALWTPSHTVHITLTYI